MKQTLSQRGLALRLGLSVSTIRRRGAIVIGHATDNFDVWREHWERGEICGACRSYTLVSVLGAPTAKMMRRFRKIAR